MRIMVIILFIAMCVAQLTVPGMMIWESERVVANGAAYKFRTQPIDPSDPFRGKYIILNFLSDHARDTADWTQGEPVNVVFTADSVGFAVVSYLTRQEPDGPYLKSTVNYVDSDSNVHFHIPFDRFYMEESKALPAEQYYRRSMLDSSQVCYGLVRMGHGNAVITGVYVNDRSIADIVKELNAQN